MIAVVSTTWRIKKLSAASVNGTDNKCYKHVIKKMKHLTSNSK